MKILKPRGFKDYSDMFWVNERGKYGCVYKCKHCGKQTLGLTDRKYMHWTTCQTREETP